MNIRLAVINDVAALTMLEQQHQYDELAAANLGLQGQTFSQQELSELVEQHWVVVAEVQQQIVGYVIAGSWAFFASWPMYRSLLNRLPKMNYHGATLTRMNSCQYGPIWIADTYRGQGVFEALIAELRMRVAPHYPYMLTFIAEDNERSFAAHTKKGAMQVVDFFTVSERDYYLLVVETVWPS